MEKWKDILRKSISSPEELTEYLDVDIEEIREVIDVYPMRITPYMLDLIKEKDDPIARQVIPSRDEIFNQFGSDDPLNENTDSPVVNLVHRYPDRALLIVTNQCPAYCRFCTRKRLVGRPDFVTNGTIYRGIEYIREHKEIRDVILSGGDPLLLTDELLERILRSLRDIPHVEIIRIGTRIPCTLPQRITSGLCKVLKRYHPVYINLHFNHPDEITPESRQATEMLADTGIPLGCQTVLLKGINDDPDTMKRLMHRLLEIRVRPYYLYQADIVNGTDHFRTTVECGLDVIRSLHGFTSGLAIPNYVIDTPGGGGKITILPNDFVLHFDNKEIILKNYENNTYKYPQITEPMVKISSS
ncbi:MAG: KamA family radical SAM protein [Nitrospirota bacterium]